MSEPTRKILIVDDSKEIIETLESCLSHQYKITAFNNPIDALENYKTDSDYYALIVDIRMPEMTGVELSQKVIEINSNQPIVIMTGFADTENILKALKIESLVRIIKKPYDINDMLETLASIEKN